MKSKTLLIKRVFSLIALLTILGFGQSKAQSYVTIGSGSLTNTGITYPAPYGNFFYGARQQFLILASELTASNVSANSIISQIGFNVQTPIAAPIQNFTIKMAPTAATTLTTTFITAGLTQMMDPITYTTVTGWNTHTFTNGGFVWDGTSNLLVEVCFNNTSWTTNAISYYSTTASTRTSMRYADASGNCNDQSFITSTARPNMRLTIGGVNLPPPIAPLANFQFVLGVDTLWERSPSILTNTSTYQDKSYWDITGYNDDSLDGVWDPYFTVRQPNVWGTWIDTVGNKTNFNGKFPLAGYYKVKLLCVNLFGVSSIEKIVYVALPTVKPRAYFFANRSLTGVGDQIQMYDASSNGPIGWSWWLDPPCITCGLFINEFFPSNDLPRPVLNANEGGKYNVCMAVWNDVGGDTICRKQYVEIIDGFYICNGNDSVTKSPRGYIYPRLFPTYTSIYYNAAASCPANSPGFRIAPCADTIYMNLERLKLRNQDTLQVRSGGFNGPIIRKWGGNNLGGIPDSSKNFKFVGQEVFIRFAPGTPNTPDPLWIADSGFALRWSISPATFGAPTTNFSSLDTVYSGYKMTFNNQTQGSNIAFAWDLNGDGNYGMDNATFPDSVTSNPSYTYYSFIPVTKNVCLRARNCQGSSTKCKNVVVLPIARAPLADFVVNKTNGFTTDTFMFTDVSQYGSSSWKWTFNPSSVTYIMGTSSTSQNPIVKLNVAQSYDVTLEATNPFGTTATTKTAYITTLSYSTPSSIYQPAASDLDFGITRVRLNGTAGKIDSITPLKDAPYRSYYLASQCVVYRGGSYSLEVYRETAKDAENLRAWADFNRNTNYTDAGEALATGSLYDKINQVKVTIPFTVPSDASTGLTRMLIGASADFSTITPSLSTLGVYEDHGLIVAQDNTKPIIKLNGDAVLHTEVDQPFVDPFVTATDNIEGDISNRVVVVGTIDIHRLGYYTLKYAVTDYYGNTSDTVSRLVLVEVSTIPPTLTISGPDSIVMEVYSKFPEPGYTAIDHLGKIITGNVVIGGDLDTAHIGRYKITYTISDAFNNKATGARVVYVKDTQKPIIQCRYGANVTTVDHEIKTAFEDNDYIKVTDNYDRNLQYAREGFVNTNKGGIYQLVYRAVDASGNVADAFILYVRVKNTQLPGIHLIGEPDIVLNVFGKYTEYGAVATDYEGNNIPVDIDPGSFTSSVVGDYTIIYSTIDAFGNSNSVTRSVRVKDTEAPKIEILGKDPYYILVNGDYNEPGFKVTDNYYAYGQLKIRVDSNAVNKKKLGTYYVYYNASDNSGNVAAEKSRMVIVVDQLTGVNELMNNDGYAIYPNPANNFLNVDLKSGSIKTLTVIDMQGKSTHLVPESIGNSQFKLDITNHTPGLYLIQIETNDGKIINSKFTIIK